MHYDSIFILLTILNLVSSKIINVWNTYYVYLMKYEMDLLSIDDQNIFF